MKVGVMRAVVIERDGGCVAATLDPDAGPCHDRWGVPMSGMTVRLDRLEVDYVRGGATGTRHELPSDHVAVCPGHHRGAGPTGGKQWATANRPLLRAYLRRVSP